MAVVSSMFLLTEIVDLPIGQALFAHSVVVAFVLTALIEMFSPLSGAHFNPVVTMIMWFEKKVTTKEAGLFVLMQFIGGILGTLLAHLMFWDQIQGLFFVSTTQRSGSAYFGELLATFILLLAILLLTKTKSDKSSIVVGFLVGGQIMATSSMIFANPQVTIARIFTNTPTGIRPFDAFVFIVLQLAGTLLAYGVYKFMFKGDVEHD